MSRERLERELGGSTLPAEVAALPDDELAALADRIAEARRRQSQELAWAADQALDHVPRVLRGAVKKAVGL